MREFIINIGKLAFGGAGFGHLDGKACFIPFTAPGDRVRARTIREKSSFLEAELLELIDPSPLRCEPVCPVFGQCGGCSLQHISYEEQLRLKEELFAEQLWRFARVERQYVRSIEGAEDRWNYRTRVQIKARWIDGSLKMGFYRTGSHFVVPFPSSCPIASPVINGLLSGLDDLISSSPEPDRIPQIDVATGDDGQHVVIIHYIGSHPDVMAEFLLAKRDRIPSVPGLCLQLGRKETLRGVYGIERLSYSLHGSPVADLRLSFSRGGFSQVNFRQNRRLVSMVSEMAGLKGAERVLDLYCGNGNFSLPLALSAGEVTGIEEYAPSIEDARRNAEENSMKNTRFYCADAVEEVQNLAVSGEHFDLVVLDPPRAGAPRLVQHLQSLGARSIIYVSCDPVTLARDIANLRKSGYRVACSVPVDMFPHTYHIESVTLLERF